MSTESEYECRGITMPQSQGAPSEGYVACYRAGHDCPPKIAIRTADDRGVFTQWRCPCCGGRGVSHWETTA